MLSSRGHIDKEPHDEMGKIDPKLLPKVFPVITNVEGRITLTSVSVGKDTFKDLYSLGKMFTVKPQEFNPLKIIWPNRK